MEKRYTLANLAHTAMVGGTIVGMLMTEFQNLGFQVGNFNAVRGPDFPYRVEITYPKQGFAICIQYEATDQLSAMGMNTLTPEELEELDPYIKGCRWKADQIMNNVNARTGGNIVE
jgi:hypothetical protein